MKKGNDSGLTIVEIILAMSFTAVIIVILFAALRLGHKAQEKGEIRADDSQKVRVVTERLQWLVRGAYPYILAKAGKPMLFFRGKSDSIGLVTSSIDKHGKGPEDSAGLKWVSLFTDSEGLKVTEKVYFLEDVFEDRGGKTYVLDPEVTKIEFGYYDLPEDEDSGEWVSEWDEENKPYLPTAVRMRITYTRNGLRAEMPEMIIAIHAQKKQK